MKDTCYRLQRKYVCTDGRIVEDFLDAIPADLVIHKDFDRSVFGTCHTLWNMPIWDKDGRSAGIYPYQYMPQTGRDFDKRFYIPRGKVRYAKVIFDALKDAIRRQWDPKRTHVVSHSSGMDTRLIAYVIKKIAEEEGEQWLGDLVFFEADGEAESTRKLLELEGWKDPKLVVYNPDYRFVDEYHEGSFDFAEAWLKFNGLVGFPMNVWWDPVIWMLENYEIPSLGRCQFFSGFGRNEIAKTFNQFKPLNHYFNWIYYHPLACFRTLGDWNYPFWDFEFLKTLQQCRRWRYRKTGITRAVVEVLFPESLVVRPMTIEDRNMTVRRVSDRLLKKCVEEYRTSWFGTHVDPVVRPSSGVMDYGDWWGCWLFASLCEHLKEEGYNLEAIP